MAISRTIDAVARAVESSAAVSAAPGDRMEVQVAGLVIDPKVIEAAITEPDVTLMTGVQLTALDGLIGGADEWLGGLDRSDDLISVEPGLDGYMASPAGQWVMPGAVDEDSNHLSTFNATVIEDFGLAVGARGDRGSPSGQAPTPSGALGDEAGRLTPGQDADAPTLALVDIVVGQTDGPDGVAVSGADLSGSSGDAAIVLGSDGTVIPDSGDALAALVQGIAIGLVDASDLIIA